jgi:late competence protein required for DNA uptake (superfamily II DNA/RNA helicase)
LQTNINDVLMPNNSSAYRLKSTTHLDTNSQWSIQNDFNVHEISQTYKQGKWFCVLFRCQKQKTDRKAGNRSESDFKRYCRECIETENQK